MVRWVPSRARRREALVLLVGGLAAGALVTAASIAVPDRDAASEAALTRATSEVLGEVRARWRALLTAEAWPVDPPDAERAAWPRLDPRALVEPLQFETLPAPRAASVFDLLLAEARAMEARGVDLADARATVEEALERFPEDARAPEGHLTRVRLLARLAREQAGAPGDAGDAEPDGDALEQALRAARAEALAAVPLTVARDDVPYPVLIALASGTPLRVGAEAPAEDLARVHLAGDRVESGPDGPRLVLDPRFEVVRENVAWPEADAWLPFRRGQAFTRALGAAVPEAEPADPEGARRRVLRSPLGAWRLELDRTSDDGSTPAFRLTPDELHAALLASGPLPADFRVQVRGAAEVGGERVREGLVLAAPATGGAPGPEPAELRFDLVHPRPDRIASAGAGRVDALRVGFLVMALAVGGGAWVTARAMARERRAAELKVGFVAGVSHDLRTPLASILLMAENLEAGRVTPERSVRYHASIRREAERLRRLVDNVLDFARVERGEPARLVREDVDLSRLAEELVQEARERVSHGGGTLEIEVGDLPDHGHLDVDALRRALGNLLDNGLRHGGGALSLQLAHRTDAGAPAGHLVCRVSDRGPGVPAARREALFAPFERGTRDAHHAGGSGLGLAIVRAVARAHGGDARILDGPGGRGCTLELTLALGAEGDDGGPADAPADVHPTDTAPALDRTDRADRATNMGGSDA